MVDITLYQPVTRLNA